MIYAKHIRNCPILRVSFRIVLTCVRPSLRLVLKTRSMWSWPDLFSRAVGSDSVTLSSNERLDSHLSKQGRLQITTAEQYVSRFSWSPNMTSLLFCFVSSTTPTCYVYWPTTILIDHEQYTLLPSQLAGHVENVAREQTDI